MSCREGKRITSFDPGPLPSQCSHLHIEAILVNLPKVSALTSLSMSLGRGERLALLHLLLQQIVGHRSSEEELEFTVGLSSWKKEYQCLGIQGICLKQREDGCGRSTVDLLGGGCFHRKPDRARQTGLLEGRGGELWQNVLSSKPAVPFLRSLGQSPV